MTITALKIFFSLLFVWMCYVVITTSIKSNLIKVSSLEEKNIISIDHPYIYKKINDFIVDLHKTITISSIGKINDMKK